MARKIHEATPQETHFCRLRTEGYTQHDAYRAAFNRPDMDSKRVNEAASRLSAKPQLQATLRELYSEAKKSHMLSHGRWLGLMLDAFEQAMAANNLTAAASFGRLMGSGIGSLSETLKISDERMSDEQLLDKLAGENPSLAEAMRKVIGGRKTFH